MQESLSLRDDPFHVQAHEAINGFFSTFQDLQLN